MYCSTSRVKGEELARGIGGGGDGPPWLDGRFLTGLETAPSTQQPPLFFPSLPTPSLSFSPSPPILPLSPARSSPLALLYVKFEKTVAQARELQQTSSKKALDVAGPADVPATRKPNAAETKKPAAAPAPAKAATGRKLSQTNTKKPAAAPAPAKAATKN